MLDLMRKHAGSWMIKFVLGAIIVVFAFWGVGTFNARRLTTVATVDDTIITFESYRDAYSRLLEQIRQRFGDNLDENLLKAMNLKQQAIEQLVNERLLTNEAQRLGLEVTDEELARAIRGVEVFQGKSGFDYDRYRRVLSANRLTPENFEIEQRQAILLGKLRAIVSDTVKVADIEARQWFDFINTKIALDFVRFDPDQFPQATVSEQEIQAYYDAHKDDYRTSPMRRVRYLFFDPASFAGQAVVSDEDVAEYYESNTAEFHQEESIEARHVLIGTAETDSPEAVEAARSKALEVEKLAREGKDFAELARTYSTDPSASSNGGFLGRFNRRRMVAPFSDKAFSMKAGEISDPVKTRFGWHIIKVEKAYPATTKPLEQVSASIRAKLLSHKTKVLAAEAAEAAWDAAYDRNDLEAVAADLKLTLNTTALFGRSGPTEAAIADKAKFAAAAFAAPINDISDVEEMSDGYYILQVVQEQPATTPALADIQDAVTADALREKRSQEARQAAETLLAAARGGEDLAALAKARNLTVDSTGLFGRQEPIPKIGASGEISEAAFGLSTGAPWPERVLKADKHWYVVRLTQRQAPEQSGFAAQKDRIASQLLRQKKAEAFDALLARLRQGSDIDIKQDMLE